MKSKTTPGYCICLVPCTDLKEMSLKEYPGRLHKRTGKFKQPMDRVTELWRISLLFLLTFVMGLYLKMLLHFRDVGSISNLEGHDNSRAFFLKKKGPLSKNNKGTSLLLQTLGGHVPPMPPGSYVYVTVQMYLHCSRTKLSFG